MWKFQTIFIPSKLITFLVLFFTEQQLGKITISKHRNIRPEKVTLFPFLCLISTQLTQLCKKTVVVVVMQIMLTPLHGCQKNLTTLLFCKFNCFAKTLFCFVVVVYAHKTILSIFECTPRARR